MWNKPKNNPVMSGVDPDEEADPGISNWAVLVECHCIIIMQFIEKCLWVLIEMVFPNMCIIFVYAAIERIDSASFLFFSFLFFSFNVNNLEFSWTQNYRRLCNTSSSLDAILCYFFSPIGRIQSNTSGCAIVTLKLNTDSFFKQKASSLLLKRTVILQSHMIKMSGCSDHVTTQALKSWVNWYVALPPRLQ